MDFQLPILFGSDLKKLRQNILLNLINITESITEISLFDDMLLIVNM